MPRAHTEQERERIRERLMQTGREGFVRVGLAKMTIAELARDAGIGKGSFYRFFESKEALFLAIQEHEEQAFKAALVQRAERAGNAKEAVTTLLLATTTSLKDHPFLRLLLDPRTLSELTLRVPPERMAVHRGDDRAFFFELVASWKRRGWLRPELEAQTVFDVLTATFGLSLHDGLLGESAMQRASEELAAALADRWCPPEP